MTTVTNQHQQHLPHKMGQNDRETVSPPERELGHPREQGDNSEVRRSDLNADEATQMDTGCRAPWWPVRAERAVHCGRRAKRTADDE